MLMCAVAILMTSFDEAAAEMGDVVLNAAIA
jgi:hypothetical protein